MINRIRTIYPHGLYKGFSSKFHEGSQIWFEGSQVWQEGSRIQQETPEEKNIAARTCGLFKTYFTEYFLICVSLCYKILHFVANQGLREINIWSSFNK